MMPFAIHAGLMFDGKSVSGPTTVFVEDGRITGVDTSGALPPEGMALVDLGPEAFLMPGLIDPHTHLGFDAGPDPVTSFTTADDAELLAWMRTAAGRALHAGDHDRARPRRPQLSGADTGRGVRAEPRKGTGDPRSRAPDHHARRPLPFHGRRGRRSHGPARRGTGPARAGLRGGQDHVEWRPHDAGLGAARVRSTPWPTCGSSWTRRTGSACPSPPTRTARRRSGMRWRREWTVSNTRRS